MLKGNVMGSAGASRSTNQNWAMSESESGGYNQGGQQATNVTGQQSTSGQNVWGAQGGALQDLYGQAQALMGGSSPYGQAGAGVGQAGMNAWQGQLTPGANPYFDQAVQASIDQATDSFKRQVLPELDARSAGAGQLGSSRDRLATGEAAGLFGQSVAQTAAQQRSEMYQSDQNRVMQAIGMTPSMMQSQYAPLSVAASLIGGPTVLSNAQSSGWGNAQSSGWSDAQNWANSMSYGGGSGKGKSWDMGILKK
jgi:hypothetical protein